jgi:hypothetical protein
MKRSDRIIAWIMAFISMSSMCTKITVPELSSTQDAGGILTSAVHFVKKLSMNWNDIGINSVVLMMALVCLYYLYGKHTQVRKLSLLILSVIFAVCTLIGLSFTNMNSADFLVKNKYQILLSAYMLIGYTAFYHAALHVAYHYFLQWKPHKNDETWTKKDTRKFFFLSFAAILGVWMIYLIVFYPGSIPYDGYYQLNMYYGINPLSTHHPVFTTKLIGFIVSLGEAVWNINFGVFLFVLFQSIVCAAIYAYICSYVRILTKNRAIAYLSVLFFAITPMWGSFAQTLGKDTLYYSLFALYFVLLVQFFLDPCKLLSKRGIVFFFVALLLVLFRKDAIFVVIPSLIAIFFAVSKFKVTAILLLLCVLIGNTAYNTFFVSEEVKNVTANPYEAYSVMLQQTARYVQEYGDEVTSEEQSVIDKVLNYSTLADRYDPNCSDSVKDGANWSASDEEISDYIHVWFSMFWKHPGVYISATLNNSFGYLYPFYRYTGLTAYKFYIMGEPLNTGALDIHYVGSTSLRNLLTEFVTLADQMPGLSIIMSCGSYGWLLLLAIVLAFMKGFKNTLVLVAPFFSLLISIASPVNAYVRYTMPLMAAAPAMIAFIIYLYKGQRTDGELQNRSEDA